jgi:hypothetical protein
MKKERLDRLLERYFNGETTGEEERELRVFFNENKIPEGYETEKALFSYYFNEAKVPEPASDFESRIMTAIDQSDEIQSPGKSRRLILTVLSTAAGIIIMAGSYFYFVHQDQTADTYSDPKLAYAETMKILFDVSAKMNKGVVALGQVTTINDITAKSFATINKSTNIVGKNLKSLDYLQKAIELTSKTIPDISNKK